MATVVFASAFQRHVPVPSVQTAGGTLREVLESVFSSHPQIRGYVLDDQGGVRKHVAIVVDGTPAADRRTLSDPVPERAEVFVLQALSGG